MLVEKAEIKFSASSYVLELLLPNAKVLKLPLNEELNGQLRVDLEKIAEKAEWNIQPIDVTKVESQKNDSPLQSNVVDQPKLLH